jgi:alpha-glucosidase
MPFTGMDIGGFTGTPTQSLYAKWMQVGAFTPYFRNHSAYDTKASEPWTFGEDVLAVSREYISLRYRLMPYLYSAFHEASASGMPVMRSLAIEHTHDPKVYAPSFQNQYMFGPAFLVMPFESTRQAGKVYFPAGRWYNFHDDSVEQGGAEKLIELSVDKLPVYVRAGSIVPMQSQVQSTAEQHDGTLVLHVYRGDSASSFSYYEDDGKSFANEQGGYFKRTITLDPARRRIDFGKAEGAYASRFSKIKLVPHGFGDTTMGDKVMPNDGKAFSITY